MEWTGLKRWNDRGHVSALIAMVSHAQRCRKTINGCSGAYVYTNR